jgi:hypothetical protein
MNLVYFSSFHSKTSLLGGTAGRQLELLQAIKAHPNIVLFYGSSNNDDTPWDTNTIFYLVHLQRFLPSHIFDYISSRIPPGIKLALLLIYLLLTRQLKTIDKLFIYDQIGCLSLIIYPFLRIFGVPIIQHLCELHSTSDYRGSLVRAVNQRINLLSLFISRASYVCMNPAFQQLSLLRSLHGLYLPPFPTPLINGSSIGHLSEIDIQSNRILVVTNGAPRDDIPFIAAEVSRLRPRPELILLGVNTRFLKRIHQQILQYSSLYRCTTLSNIPSDQYVRTLHSSPIVILPRGTHASLRYCFPSRVLDILAYAKGSLIIGKCPHLSRYLETLDASYSSYYPRLQGSLTEAIDSALRNRTSISLSPSKSQDLSDRLYSKLHTFLLYT